MTEKSKKSMTRDIFLGFKRLVFKSYVLVNSSICGLLGKKDAIYAFGFGFFYAQSFAQRLAASLDLLPTKVDQFGKIIRENINSNGIFLDIGANIGYVSLILAKVFPGSRILSFEPFPQSREYFKLNNLESKNVEIFPIGLSNKAENIVFGIPEHLGDDENTGRVSAAVKPGEISSVAQVLVGDDFLNSSEYVDQPICFMKIDVEGMEDKVLVGLTQTIKKFTPLILIELNWDYCSRDDSIFAQCDKLFSEGYSCYTYTSGKKIGFVPRDIRRNQNVDVLFIHEGS